MSKSRSNISQSGGQTRGGIKQNQILEGLFDSRVRVKVLKFLFRNYPADVDIKDLSIRVQESYETVRKEMKMFEKIGLVKKS